MKDEIDDRWRVEWKMFEDLATSKAKIPFYERFYRKLMKVDLKDWSESDWREVRGVDDP